MSPALSVIISTYNGAAKLPTILQALASQTRQPHEIIVSIDGSTDDTVAVLKSWKPTLPQLQWIQHPNGGRSKVRNRGAAVAAGGLLVFFDDDMLPITDCLQKHQVHHQECVRSIATGGLADTNGDSNSDFQCFKNHLSNKWTSEIKMPRKQPLPANKLFITAANFSISKTLFHELGGFDERLTDAEDFDLAVRAFKQGVLLYYNHDAFAWHNDVVSGKKYIGRQRQYAQAHKKLIELKPWMEAEGFIKKPVRPTGWRKKVFSFFCAPFWVNALDRGNLSWLPKRLRYRLYDVIITSNVVYFPDTLRL